VLFLAKDGAARARSAVHGRTFNGKMVEAVFYPEELLLQKVGVVCEGVNLLCVYYVIILYIIILCVYYIMCLLCVYSFFFSFLLFFGLLLFCFAYVCHADSLTN
jgi:hypothetical protein